MTPAPAPTRRVHGAWRSAFFSTIAPQLRARSGSDGVRLIVAAVTTVIVLIAWRANPSLERWWVQHAVPPPTGWAWVLTTLFLAGVFGTAALLVVFAAIVHRRDLAADLAAAAGAGLALSYLSQTFLGVRAGRHVTPVFHHLNVGFPVPLLTVVVAMVIVGRPYLARGVRRFVTLTVAIGVVGAVTTGRALPLALVGSVVVGWLGASAVRLALGRPHVGANLHDVHDALAPLGIEVTALGVDPSDPTRTQPKVEEWGVERVYVTAADQVVRRVSVYGRDARDAETLSSLWHVVSTRESGVAPFLGRQQQAEHEALATSVVANVVGDRAPRLVGLTATPAARDVLVVVAPPAGITLRERLATGPLDRPTLEAIATLLQSVRAAQVALGTISLDHLGVAPDGRVVLFDTLHAELDATTRAIDRDLASELVVLALCSDVATAVDVSLAVHGRDALLTTLSFLEKPALNPALRKEMKDDKTLLADLRKAGAANLGVAEPKVTELRRVSPMSLAIAGGSLIGGWALLGVFTNVSKSIHTLQGANWAWVAAAFVFAQLTFLASATADLGTVAGQLPLGRLTALEVANAFSRLAIGSVAVLAARVRFLQRHGYDATQAVSSGVLISLASWAVKLGLFLVALPFAWGHLHFSTHHTKGGAHGHTVADVLVAVVVVGVAVFVLAAVPRWRRNVEKRIRPKAHELRANFASVAAQPRKLLELFGGSAAQQLCVVLALGCALHALGSHLSIAAVLVALTIGSAVGGASPAAGGAGVVEAGMILALTAAGVAQPVAVAAVFIQRLFTSYLPPLWGYVTLLWLRRRDEI